MKKEKVLHKIWWLYIPVLVILAQIGLELSFDSDTLADMHNENGPHELAQFIILLGAFLVALWAFIRVPQWDHPWLAAWLGLATLCCLYVGGEEVSWGQHFLNWDTPSYWAGLNDQGETNLHNTTSWLDQKPRLILFIGAIVGGLIFPLLQKYKPGTLPARFNVIYPPAKLAVVAGIILIVKILDEVSDALDITIFVRASEIIELYLYYFVLVYLLALSVRVYNLRLSRAA